jgi:hypothetical protein
MLPAQLAEKVGRAGLLGISESFGHWIRNRQGRWYGDYRVIEVGRARTTVKLRQIQCYAEGSDYDALRQDSADQAVKKPAGDAGDAGG